MHAASRVLAAGADFTLLGPQRTMLDEQSKPVVAVVRDPDRRGQEPDERKRRPTLLDAGRHGRCSSGIRCRTAISRRSASSASPRSRTSTRHDTTIEEREEYEPHLAPGDDHVRRRRLRGDPPRRREEEADVILWDGGNNDFPFYRPDLLVVVADPLRPGTSCATTPARRTSAWPTSSSSTRPTPPSRRRSSGARRDRGRSTRRRRSSPRGRR